MLVCCTDTPDPEDLVEPKACLQAPKETGKGEHKGWSAAQTPLIQRTWLAGRRLQGGAPRLVCSTDTPDPEDLVEH